MTNVEIRMTKEFPNDSMTKNGRSEPVESFGLRHSFVIGA